MVYNNNKQKNNSEVYYIESLRCKANEWVANYVSITAMF